MSKRKPFSAAPKKAGRGPLPPDKLLLIQEDAAKFDAQFFGSAHAYSEEEQCEKIGKAVRKIMARSPD